MREFTAIAAADLGVSMAVLAKSSRSGDPLPRQPSRARLNERRAAAPGPCVSWRILGRSQDTWLMLWRPWGRWLAGGRRFANTPSNHRVIAPKTAVARRPPARSPAESSQLSPGMPTSRPSSRW